VSATTPPIDVLLVAPLDEERDALLVALRRGGAPPTLLPAVVGESSVYYRATLPVAAGAGATTAYALIVTCIGAMGSPEAAAAVTSALARWRPRAVVIVGIAGGIAANEAALGDLLVANRIIGYEQAKARPTGAEHRWQPYDVDRGLLQRARAFTGLRWHGAIAGSRPERGRPARHYGPIGSGEKIIQDPALLAELLATWPKLVGVEMEGVGGAAGTRQASPPPALAMIRAVSDLANPDKESVGVRAWRPYACAVAAAFAVAFLRTGPLPSLQGVGGGRPTDPAMPPPFGALGASPVATAGSLGPLLRAIDRASPDRAVRAEAFMAAFTDDALGHLAPPGGPVPATPDDRLRAAIGASAPIAAAFADAARAAADHNAAPVALALFQGLAGLIAHFPHSLIAPAGNDDPPAELAIFLAHEAFLTLIAHLLRARRWALLADILGRHIFMERHPLGPGAGNVPYTLLATPGTLLSTVRKGIRPGPSPAPGRGAPRAPRPHRASCGGLRRRGPRGRRPVPLAARGRRPGARSSPRRVFLARAVARETALALAGALGLGDNADGEASLRGLRHFLQRQGEQHDVYDFPWMAGFDLDILRIGTA